MTAAVATEHKFSCFGDSVLSSAPSKDQVKGLLWKQIGINRMNASRPLPGQFLRGGPELVVPGRPDWWAEGFSTDKPERAQGKKHPRILVVVDEAAGMPDWFWEAIDSSMAVDAARMLLIGNPSDRMNMFRNCFTRNRALYNCITISSLDSPCISVEQAWELWELVRSICPALAEEMLPQVEEKVDEDPILGLATYTWCRERILEWSDDLNKLRRRVFGLFPSDEDSKAIPVARIEAAQRLWLELEAEEKYYVEKPRIHCACLDPAGEGPDNSVLSYLQGQRVHVAWATNEPDTTNTAMMAARWVRDLPEDQKPAWISVDVGGGLGKGVYDTLRRIRREHPEWFGRCRVVKYYPGQAARDKQQYVFAVDEVYFLCRDALDPRKPRHQRIALPPDNRVPWIERRRTGAKKKALSVVADLNARGYSEDIRERKRVEGKKELDARNAPSPDIGDSITGLWFRPKITQFKAA